MGWSSKYIKQLTRVLTTAHSFSDPHKISLVGGGFNQPIWKIYIRQIGSWNPRDRGESKKYLKPPPIPLLYWLVYRGPYISLL